MAIKKILVANRGEIACRVFKTAKRLGIKTVAVYSDADRHARHVQMADEAVHIGLAPASESYLCADKIIKACQDSGADAVHPGYGFLSERAEFCAALSAANITFIGPPPKAIEAMGDKITSKKIAQQAGVSTVPGHMGIIETADDAVKISQNIGYPVMIKASAGGGGKGMRIAYDDAQAREGFARARSEAAASFGDDRIFVEKFIQQPRHIEIQILADQHGNCVYLGERECSIQRRNQKVIEEAPSPFLDDATRAAMGAQSCALAQAVDYTSAGTVEFIVDADRNFYFLEMNTRLQVEHPITELITGVDLVEQMINVANGQPLSIRQADIKLHGWAMESRIYAEDPYRNFLPSIGRLTRYRPPVEQASDTLVVRNDTGVFEGGEISIHYDPMVAKLCTWAPDRPQAINAMQTALDRFELEGIAHNVPFLSAVMGHERFQSGEISTNFIAQEYPDGFAGVTPDAAQLVGLIAAALIVDYHKYARINARAKAFAHGSDLQGDKIVRINRCNHAARLTVTEAGFEISHNNQTFHCQAQYALFHTLMVLTIDKQEYAIKVDRIGTCIRLRHAGIDLTAQVMRPRVAELAELMPEKQPMDQSNLLLCPMPGAVVDITVKQGENVQEGQTLAIIEAMKMENTLRAPRASKIAKICVAKGDSLGVDDVIIEFEK